MIDFYNAFISYKHAPLDSKVAEHVQRNLEHFHIPKAIRKYTGRDRIERIFRDKDELPITSDLSDIIANALSKAEYLIVICSPNTKKSVWVTREIEYFLRNHTKEQILTVLAEGEPEDVIPDLLKYDERELKDVSGNMTKVRVPRDLLSCDYRMSFSKAKKLELPRLASTLIGCSYDELVRRQRTYKIRRAMILASLLLLALIGFGTYMTISKRKVDLALKQALINRSRYLAAESDDLFEQQRSREALYLALAALPSEDNPDIPVVGEAVSSLSQATYAYRGQQEFSFAPVWDYSTGNVINDYWVNEDGTMLAVIDAIGIVTVWNTESHNVVMTIEYPGLYPNQCLFAANKIVLAGAYTIRGFDLNSGTLIWDIDVDSEDSSGDEINCDVFITNDGMLMSVGSRGTIRIIDPASGEIVSSTVIPSQESDPYYRSYAISPDCSKLAFGSYSYGLNESVIGVYDINAGTVAYLDPVEELVFKISWADNSRLMAMTCDFNEVDFSTLYNNGLLATFERNVFCFDTEDMDLLWNDTFECTSNHVFSGFVYLDSYGLIGAYSGNRFNCYDAETGDLVRDWIVNDNILDASYLNSEGLPVIITEFGDMMIPEAGIGQEYIRSIFDFAGEISGVIVNGDDYYVMQGDAERIISYNTCVYDEDWVQTEGVTVNYMDEYYLDDNVMVILTETEAAVTATLINPNDNTLIDNVPIDANALECSIDLLGADDDNVYISCASNDLGVILYTIGIADGSSSSRALSDAAVLYENSVTYSDGYLCYVTGTYDEPKVTVQAAAGGELFDVPAPESYDYMKAPRYFPEASYIFLTTVSETYFINADNGEYSEVDLPDNWNGSVMVEYDPQLNEFVLCDTMHILFVKPSTGEVYYSIDDNGIMITGYDFVFTGTDYLLLVAYNGGSLIRYNAYTGDYVGNSDISHNNDNSNFTLFDVDQDSGLLYIQQGLVTSVVDMESWVEMCHVDNSFGHHAPTDRFYTASYGDDEDVCVGYFRHYTLEELIARANEMLGGIPAPDYLVRLYGL